jgi:hypothetical protein
LSLNNVVQQIYRTLHFLEGRVGLIGLRDGFTMMGRTEPARPSSTLATVYFDEADGKLRASELGDDFQDIIPELLSARIYNSVNQTTTTGVPFTASFDSERWDFGSFHNATNPTRLTIPETGLYDVGTCVAFTANATGVRQLLILVNGSADPIAKLSLPPPAANKAIMSLQTQWYFTAGDYIELQTFQTSGGNLDIEIQATHSVEFWATKVR